MAVKWVPLAGFKSRKAAQIAARFVELEGGRIGKLKLIKLIYLAERQFMSEHGFPMLYDEFYSLPHGPVCSSTLNGINGHLEKKKWGLLATAGRKLVTKAVDGSAPLDELSKAEIAVLKQTYESFGFMTGSQLRNWTHKHCPEYTETTGRVPIDYVDLFKAVGLPEAEELAAEVRAHRKVASILPAA